ncbi:DUF2946 family protein [Herbaspirillum sp. RTI4]|uniref:DUF2946 family protein n=1 Tax=Herbaspirillum sp. RTI4 TaxID=3048640 RepID=UPI002AB3482F|nr:DUF2946 family protein [Herbaspirillum sp. RTI4]MDY7576804.1 DUF2946 family protein [Herbaspirillum sp. RTI4]MEA9981400.1 DUF2946 family protein [Herbaspirillum sp. RTI4]
MDEQVKLAMQKWPNVPHCFGWLALDARGAFRMRDERTQALNLTGDRIQHEALLAFIHRNYNHDAQGRWYFQNGPQRVFVDLQLTPWIAHTDASAGFLLHDGNSVDAIAEVLLSDAGQFFLTGDFGVAAIDDRDSAECLALLRMDQSEPSEAALLAWLEGTSAAALCLQWRGQSLPVRRIDTDALSLPLQFGFIAKPRE